MGTTLTGDNSKNGAPSVPTPTITPAELENLRREAMRSFQKSVAEQQQQVARQHQQFADLIRQARENHKHIRAEQKQMSAAVRRDIDAIMESARKDQAATRAKRQEELKSLRSQITELEHEANKRIGSAPVAERQARSTELRKLLREAEARQRELEKAEEEKSKREQQDFAVILHELTEERRRLQKIQQLSLKRFLDECVNEMNRRQKQLKEDYDKMLERCNEEMNTLLKGTRISQKQVIIEARKRALEDKEFLDEKMKERRRMILSGKIQEAYRIQVEVRRRIADTQAEMQKIHRNWGVRVRLDFSQFEVSSAGDMKKLEEEGAKMLSAAREMLERQSKSHISMMLEEMAGQLKDEAGTLEQRMFEKHENLQVEQLELIKGMRLRIERHARETLLRCSDEYGTLVQSAKRQMREMEERQRSSNSDYGSRHGVIMQGGKNQVSQLDQEIAVTQARIGKEQQLVVDERLNETAKLIRELRANPRAGEEALRLDEMSAAARFDIARDTSAAQAVLKSERRALDLSTTQSIMAHNRIMQERLKELKQERERLQQSDSQKRLDLERITREEMTAFEKDCQMELFSKQQSHEENVRKIMRKKNALEMDREMLTRVRAEAMQNQQRLEAGVLAPEAAEKQRELMKLITDAEKQHSAIAAEYDIILENAQKDAQIVMRDTVERQRARKDEMQKRAAEARKSLEEECAKAHMAMHRERELIAADFESCMKAVNQKREQGEERIRNEQRLILDQTQRKLRELSGGF